jgi:predicted peptidase
MQLLSKLNTQPINLSGARDIYMKHVIAVLIWIQIFQTWNLKANDSLAKTQVYIFEKHLSVSREHDTLPYRILAPMNMDRNKKYPLLIYLHGAGARGNDNETPVNKLSKEFTDSVNRINYPCYILVPQCAATDAWVTFPYFPNTLATTDTPTISCRMVLELIRELMLAKNIDSGRIYLTGYSLGGEGTFDMISRAQDLFACAVPLASVADTSKAHYIKDIPIWAFHGGDDNLNDPKYTKLMIDAIRSYGGNPKYTVFEGVKHDCRKEAYSSDELWQWMFAQRRKK